MVQKFSIQMLGLAAIFVSLSAAADPTICCKGFVDNRDADGICTCQIQDLSPGSGCDEPPLTSGKYQITGAARSPGAEHGSQQKYVVSDSFMEFGVVSPYKYCKFLTIQQHQS